MNPPLSSYFPFHFSPQWGKEPATIIPCVTCTPQIHNPSSNVPKVCDNPLCSHHPLAVWCTAPELGLELDDAYPLSPRAFMSRLCYSQ